MKFSDEGLSDLQHHESDPFDDALTATPDPLIQFCLDRCKRMSDVADLLGISSNELQDYIQQSDDLHTRKNHVDWPEADVLRTWQEQYQDPAVIADKLECGVTTVTRYYRHHPELDSHFRREATEWPHEETLRIWHDTWEMSRYHIATRVGGVTKARVSQCLQRLETSWTNDHVRQVVGFFQRLHVDDLLLQHGLERVASQIGVPVHAIRSRAWLEGVLPPSQLWVREGNRCDEQDVPPAAFVSKEPSLHFRVEPHLENTESTVLRAVCPVEAVATWVMQRNPSIHPTFQSHRCLTHPDTPTSLSFDVSLAQSDEDRSWSVCFQPPSDENHHGS